MRLKDRLLAEIAKDPVIGHMAGRGWYSFGDMAANLADDEAVLALTKDEIDRRLELAVRFERDAAQQREEAARLAAALAAVTGTHGEN